MKPFVIIFGAALIAFIVVAVFVEYDRQHTPDLSISATQVEECFENDNYLESVRKNLATNGHLDGEAQQKYTKIKTTYYVDCINKVRSANR